MADGHHQTRALQWNQARSLLAQYIPKISRHWGFNRSPGNWDGHPGSLLKAGRYLSLGRCDWFRSRQMDVTLYTTPKAAAMGG